MLKLCSLLFSRLALCRSPKIHKVCQCMTVHNSLGLQDFQTASLSSEKFISPIMIFSEANCYSRSLLNSLTAECWVSAFTPNAFVPTKPTHCDYYLTVCILSATCQSTHCVPLHRIGCQELPKRGEGEHLVCCREGGWSEAKWSWCATTGNCQWVTIRVVVLRGCQGEKLWRIESVQAFVFTARLFLQGLIYLVNDTCMPGGNLCTDDNEQTASHVCVLVAMQKVKDFGFKFQPGPIYQISCLSAKWLDRVLIAWWTVDTLTHDAIGKPTWQVETTDANDKVHRIIFTNPATLAFQSGPIWGPVSCQGFHRM